MTSALMAAIAARKAQTSNVKTIKPNVGRNRYRILPSWRNIANSPSHLSDEEKAAWADTFWVDFGQHFIKDASGQVKAVYLCVDKTYGRPCPVCDEINRGILNSTDDITKKRLEGAKAGGRVLVNVLALDTPTPTIPQVLELAPSAFNGKKGVGGIIQGFVDWPNMVSLDNGCDVIIEKSGAGLDTAYGVSFVPTQAGALPKTILTRLSDLDKFVAQENAAAQQRAIAGVSAISGLLPHTPRPSLSQAAAAAFAAPAVAEVLDDVPDFPTAAVAVQPVTATATAVVQPSQTVQMVATPAAPAQPTVADNDLEALLADL